MKLKYFWISSLLIVVLTFFSHLFLYTDCLRQSYEQLLRALLSFWESYWQLKLKLKEGVSHWSFSERDKEILSIYTERDYEFTHDSVIFIKGSSSSMNEFLFLEYNETVFESYVSPEN